MKPVRKRSLAGEAEQELREAILSGQFGDALPGLRVLAKVLGVSPPTVAGALKALIAEGLIRSEGARRRMTLVRPEEKPFLTIQDSTKVLWFVTAGTFERAVHGSTELLSFLQASLGGTGWLVRHRILSYGHSENRAAQWDRMIEAERPDAMVVWSGRTPLGAWALSRNVRTLFIGGSKEELPLPMLAVRSADMVDRSLRELFNRNHRRFFLPMCNRPPAMVRTIRTTVSRRIRGLGQSVKQAVPVSAYEGREVVEAMVEQALAENPPTGWIFLDWREFLAASCVFRDRGLSIPGDASAVILSWDPAMAWYRPLPAYFDQPLERLAKEAAEWVLRDPGDSDTRYFEAEWIPGESLGVLKR